jgi:hypothetical protein
MRWRPAFRPRRRRPSWGSGCGAPRWLVDDEEETTLAATSRRRLPSSPCSSHRGIPSSLCQELIRCCKRTGAATGRSSACPWSHQLRHRSERRRRCLLLRLHNLHLLPPASVLLVQPLPPTLRIIIIRRIRHPTHPRPLSGTTSRTQRPETTTPTTVDSGTTVFLPIRTTRRDGGARRVPLARRDRVRRRRRRRFSRTTRTLTHSLPAWTLTK